MRIGAVFPHTEIGNDPAAIRDYAQAAEGLARAEAAEVIARAGVAEAV